MKIQQNIDWLKTWQCLIINLQRRLLMHAEPLIDWFDKNSAYTNLADNIEWGIHSFALTRQIAFCVTFLTIYIYAATRQAAILGTVAAEIKLVSRRFTR
jgi:hypothetical protein